MGKIKEIRREIELKEHRKDAKKVDRKDLEELYAETTLGEYSQEYVGRGWRDLALVLMLSTFVLGMVVWGLSMTYAGSETDNMKLIGSDICETQQLGKLWYIDVTENEIRTKCYNGEYTIEKE